NTFLAVFNLIPVPPLDGSGILSGLLSDRGAAVYDRMRPYGFIIVLALVLFGFLDLVLLPVLLIIKVIVFL
ncbi:MAG: site-2 protease family protein, partial [Candidatus Aminicenantales bacterium]